MRRTIRSPLPLALLLAPVLALAQDDDVEEHALGAPDRTPQECISVSRIDRTEVFDDRTVVFFVRGREAYRNYLPRRCPGLQRNGRFMYQVTANRLCDIDTITVLEQFGARLERGFTCPLGQFYPISEEEVEELRRIRDQEGGADVQVERAELPEDAERDEADGSAEAADESAEAGPSSGQAADEQEGEQEPRRRRRNRAD